MAACGQNVGIVKETWAIQQTPQGDLFDVDMAGQNFARTFVQFVASQEAFDRWQKQRMLETIGADLNTLSPGRSMKYSRTARCEPTSRGSLAGAGLVRHDPS